MSNIPDPVGHLLPQHVLSVFELFKDSVLEVPSPEALAKLDSGLPLAERLRATKERAGRELTGLLRGAEALIRALPADRTESGLGPICELIGDAALAWCISHFGDDTFPEARAAAGPPSRPADGYQHPLDYFSGRSASISTSSSMTAASGAIGYMAGAAARAETSIPAGLSTAT